MKRILAVMALMVGLMVLPAAAGAAPGAPLVQTNPATAVADSTATLNATVNPNKQATTYAFQYGTTTAYGGQTVQQSTGAGNANQSVTADVTGLAPGTTYHFRIIASNASGTSVGADMSFTTTGTPPAAPGPPPTVLTGPVTGVGHNNATLTGTINPNGSAVVYTFDYGLTAFYGMRSIQGNLPAGSAPQSVSEALSGLQQGATYHYRLVATNATGQIVVGADNTFTTTPGLAPARFFTASVRPHRVRSLPAVFRFTATLGLPPGVTSQVGCRGKVEVQIKSGRKTIVARRAALASNCVAHSKIRLSIRRRAGAGRLKVNVRFLGNDAVGKASARTLYIRIG